jgi:hypothetical protein
MGLTTVSHMRCSILLKTIDFKGSLSRIVFCAAIAACLIAHPSALAQGTTHKAAAHPDKLKLYTGFFPFHSCLLVTIKGVSKKDKHSAVLRLLIADVYRGPYRQGSTLTVETYTNRPNSDRISRIIGGVSPSSLAFLSSLNGTKQIIAFNEPSTTEGLSESKKRPIKEIRNLWIPYGGKTFGKVEIAQIKSIIKNSPTEPAQAKAAFEKFMEHKWTVERLNDFCRPETQQVAQGPFDLVPEHDWSGPLHQKQASRLFGKEINYYACVKGSVPTVYSINGFSNKVKLAWDLRMTDPDIEDWTDDDFLLFRVYRSIYQSSFAHWSVNYGKNPKAINYWTLFPDDNGTLIKDMAGNATSYRCQLRNGKIFTAILTNDKPQLVDKILIDGKFDQGWNEMYRDNLRNLARSNNYGKGE